MIYNDATYEDAGRIWFIGNLDNNIYNMNKTNEIEIIDAIPIQTADTYRMNPICLKNNDDLICLPDKAKDICIYNITSRSFYKIPIQLDVERYSINNGWVVDNTLWCLSYRSGDLIQCDLVSGDYKKYRVCNPNIEAASGEAIMLEEKIYILHRNKCRVTRFDTHYLNIKEYDLDIDERGLGTICYVDNKFYITGYKKCIYVWSEDNNCIEKIPISGVSFIIEKEAESPTTRFLKSKVVNDNIVIFTQNNNYYVSDDVIVYNFRTGSVNVYSLSGDGKKRKEGEYLIYQYSYNNSIIVQDYKIDEFWEINLLSGEVSKERITINPEKCEEYWKHHGIYSMNRENDILNLDIFLKYGVM